VYYLRAARIEPGTNRMWDVQIFDVRSRTPAHRLRRLRAAAFSGNGTDMICSCTTATPAR
jgi:hypothetical protein